MFLINKYTKHLIFHIDVNSAYLSWEAASRLQQGDSLDLRTIPSAVGGDPETRHGIILAKSIPAKKFKIQTGETLFSARTKCPDLVIVSPNYPLYRQCSTALKELVQNYSPLIQQYSVDEFFLDFTGMNNLFGNPVDTALKIKEHVKNELGFTVNIGISTNKLLAKMGSELQKPDRVHTLFPEEISKKMWPLPIDELFGVGRATSQKLRDRGIKTIGDLAAQTPAYLERFLKSYGTLIWNYANGRDISPVRNNKTIPVKGMGNSTTLSFDVTNQETAYLILLSLTETVTTRLRDAGFCAGLISVSLKTNGFVFCSHQKKLYSPTDCTSAIHEIACTLFDQLWQGEPLRHLGIRLSELCLNNFYQPSLFEEKLEKQRLLDKTIDTIRSKYGSKAVFRSSFLHSGLSPIMGGVIESEEYPMMSSLL
ncbi:MAG: DNA polymerase IV [Eubacteriales bacterium]